MLNDVQSARNDISVREFLERMNLSLFLGLHATSFTLKQMAFGDRSNSIPDLLFIVTPIIIWAILSLVARPKRSFRVVDDIARKATLIMIEICIVLLVLILWKFGVRGDYFFALLAFAFFTGLGLWVKSRLLLFIGVVDGCWIWANNFDAGPIAILTSLLMLGLGMTIWVSHCREKF